MNALATEIAEIIRAEGPISVERYMGYCLSHPTLGYYFTRDPLGAGGDFTTSPEISQMFGELLGLWAADVWTLCGKPEPAHLIELGPGRGTLMADALRASRAAGDYYAALSVTMVEISPTLQRIQQETLAAIDRPIDWRAKTADALEGPAIILANEFFDALPVRHYIRQGGAWRERQVGLDEDGGFVFGAAAETEPYLTVEAPEGAIIEVGAIAQRLMTELAAWIIQRGGVLLAIDYGYTQTALGETLQAMRAHAFADPLGDPGEADLTTQVDFAALARAARSVGAEVHGPVTQKAFLQEIGITLRAEALMRSATPEQAADIASGLARLTASDDERDMGRLFKAMAVTRSGFGPLPGFSGETSA